MLRDTFLFYNTFKYKVILCISMTVFFYLFLVFFLPFGIDNYNPNHKYTLEFLVELAKFAGGILLFSVLSEFLLRGIILKTPTLGNIILWSVWTLILLSTVTFYIYNYLGNWHDYSFKSFLGFVINCSAILIFPIVAVFFLFKYQSLQHKIERILTTKENFIDSNQLINFKGQGSKDQITLSVSSFLYGKAQDNYVELYYHEQSGLKKFLVRSSLSNLVISLDSEVIKRSHRSYMVNLLHVKAIKGSNLEMNLFLEPYDTSVPVSKTYKDSILKDLQVLKNFG